MTKKQLKEYELKFIAELKAIEKSDYKGYLVRIERFIDSLYIWAKANLESNRKVINFVNRIVNY